jgi:hypothetical protein
MVWVAVGGAAASLVVGGMSASAGKSAGKKARRDARVQQQIAGTAFSPINVQGPGGGGVTFGGTNTGFGDGTGASGGGATGGCRWRRLS